MEEWKVRNAFQEVIDASMAAYKKAQHAVGLAIYVVPTSIAVVGVLTVGAFWLLGEEMRFDKGAATLYGFLACLYAGYIGRCYFETKERVSQLCCLLVSAESLGFKVVYRPVESGVVLDGLRVVEASHPSPAVKARWGRWDALSGFVD